MDEDVAPKFTISDVKYADDEAMFGRALELFRGERVKDFVAHPRGYSGVVYGGSKYHVTLSRTKIDYGSCECYMGQNDELCKHMLALGLEALSRYGLIDKGGEPLNDQKIDASDARFHIVAGVRKIRAYDGPSRIWFSYQRDLDVGVGMIREGLAALEPALDSAKYLWKLVLKLSKKLSHGGVDDSNGTVGGVIDDIISKLVDMAVTDPKIKAYVAKECDDETGFGFEEDLANLLDKRTKS